MIKKESRVLFGQKKSGKNRNTGKRPERKSGQIPNNRNLPDENSAHTPRGYAKNIPKRKEIIVDALNYSRMTKKSSTRLLTSEEKNLRHAYSRMTKKDFEVPT